MLVSEDGMEAVWYIKFALPNIRAATGSPEEKAEYLDEKMAMLHDWLEEGVKPFLERELGADVQEAAS